MRILEGVGTLIQLAGLAARLCKVVGPMIFVLESHQPHFGEAYEARTPSSLINIFFESVALSSVFHNGNLHKYLPRRTVGRIAA
jgi:hypothetical protein